MHDVDFRKFAATMRLQKIFFFGLLCFVPMLSQAHEYFFSFVELSYNEVDRQYEGTLIAETHDIDTWFEKRGVFAGDMGFRQNDPEFLKEIEGFLFEGFSIEDLSLHLDGFEVLPDGQTNFYFHATSDPLPCLNIHYPLLMDLFKEQQNKITYLDKGEQHTALFINNQTRAKILCE